MDLLLKKKLYYNFTPPIIAKKTKAVFGSCKSISGKENVFMCLAATKFVLRKINSGVWFIQTFL